jgi:FKBP-type peptidyl-prolyl cis-trans isomerase
LTLGDFGMIGGNAMLFRFARAAALILIAFAAADPAARAALDRFIEVQNGLKYMDTKLGDGAVATSGSRVVVNYTGWLSKDGAAEKGKKFDSSLDRNQPFTFQIGKGEVIQGWDDGVSGMKVGGERILIIPPELGYGSHGKGAVIPPNSTLIFDVQLLKIE